MRKIFLGFFEHIKDFYLPVNHDEHRPSVLNTSAFTTYMIAGYIEGMWKSRMVPSAFPRCRELAITLFL